MLWVGFGVAVGVFAILLFAFCKCKCSRSSRSPASGGPAQSISIVHRGWSEAVNRGFEDTEEVNQFAYESDLSDVRDGPPVYRQLFPEGYMAGPQNNNTENGSRGDGSVVGGGGGGGGGSVVVGGGGGFITPTAPPPAEPPPSYGTVMVWGGAGR